MNAGSSPATKHLQRLASGPRQTGSDAVAAARAHCAATLRAAGFEVAEHTFTYSRFPGRYGTPLAGVISLVVLLVAVYEGRAGAFSAALAWAGSGLAVVALGGWWLGRHGVLALPLTRAQGVNLVATRTATPVRVWLTAHVDSKSQPVPMLLRVAGVVGLAIVWLATIAVSAWTLVANTEGARATAAPALWLVLGAAAIVVALPVIATTTGNGSAGAVDNASGVAAVLVAAAALGAETATGVLITDAEELGLAGARAWSRIAAPATALNCDGLDDGGDFVAMYSGRAPARLLGVLRNAAAAQGCVLNGRHLVRGVLVDSVAFGEAGFETLTLSRGNARTLRRIHTAADDLGHLRGESIETAARMLERAARELC